MSATLFLSLLLQGARVEPPDAASLKEAEKLIKDVFKEDFAKKAPSDKIALSKKLLEQAAESDADRASQFVLFREAKDLAAAGGDHALALKALKSMGEIFTVNPVALMAEVLAARGKAIKTPQEAVDLAKAYLKLTDEALRHEDLSTAEKALDQAGVQAKRAKDLPLIGSVTARSKDFVEQKAKAARLAKARDTLKTMPEDPTANQLVGYFQVTVKGEWDEGLSRLAKASDVGLKSLAEKDLASPTGAPEQAVVGDGWWDLSQKESGAPRDALLGRALLWYEKAAPKLTGLNKAKVDKRVTEGLIARLHAGDWVDLPDPGAFGAMGKSGEPIRIKGSLTLPLKARSFGRFDGFSVLVRSIDGGKPVIEFDEDKNALYVDGNGNVTIADHGNQVWTPAKTARAPVKDEQLLTLLIEDAHLVVYLDGREMLRHPTALKAVPHLNLQNTAGVAEFERVRVRRAQD